MATQKQIIEVPAMDGLQQKTAPQRLPAGKSAKAVNLQKNKQGRLEKRLGLQPLANADPFGSGYTPTTGIALGSWGSGAGQDNVFMIGRGNRPGTTALATSIQTYSDDLGGPVLRGPFPDLRVTSDATVLGSPGGVTNPTIAVSGDYAVLVWIEAEAPIPFSPAPPRGQLGWMAIQLSTGQTIAGPGLVDANSLTDGGISCVRLDVVGTTFVVAYSRYATPTPDLNIYARKLSVASLTTGGTWTPIPVNGPTQIVTNNVSLNGAFDMRAVPGDPTQFVVAYESGTWMAGGLSSPGTYTPTAIIVQSFLLAAMAVTQTWTVQSTTYRATAYGLRADNGMSSIVVCYSLPSASYSYQVYSAVASYPPLLQVNSPTIIYTPTATDESPPFFLDVSYCPGNAQGRQNYVESHSPGGSVWNAALLPATAAQFGGTGATATCNIIGSVGSVAVTSGGSYSGLSNLQMNVTGALDNHGIPSGQDLPPWSLPGGGNSPPFIGMNNTSSAVTDLDPPGSSFALETGTVATITGTTGSAIQTLSGMAAITNSMINSQVTVSGAATSANNGTFTILTTPSSSSVTYRNPGGAATDGNNGSIHWSIPAQIVGGDNFRYPLTATFTGGTGTEATATATINGGISNAGGMITITNPGQGYSSMPAVTFTGGGGGTGAAAFAVPTGGGDQVGGLFVSAPGSGYTVPPTITLAFPTATTATMTESTQCRLIGASTTNVVSENNARIISNMFFINQSFGQPVSRYTPLDGFGYCCGDATAPNSPTYQTNACSAITPGVILASRGLEANGTVYYNAWIPSQTQGGFVTLAFDLAQNPIINGGGALTGNGWPMRPVASLQSASALSDPGGGLQIGTLSRLSTTGPNMWTGGSNWFLGSDAYASAYIAYVSSSVANRLSLATGTLQTLARQPINTAQWGNLTGIAGGIVTVFDGQNAVEQNFLWAPDSVIAIATSTNIGDGLDFYSATDSYTWLFTWEQFDAQGNFHESARSTPVTITGQNLLDVLGLAPAALTQGVSYSFQFIVPTLGVTMRQWPTPNPLVSGTSPLGNDLRAFSTAPASPVQLGMYRTQKNQQTYYRVYDRGYNGNDTGGDSFTVSPLAVNTFVSTVNTFGSQNLVGTITVKDSLNDTVITRINQTSAEPFPLLYGDGTNGNPGGLDNFPPPASEIMTRHKERLFVADGNLILFTKQRGELLGPGYNTTVNSIFVGGDDPITGVASMDDKLVVFKKNQVYYVSGDGPSDDGSGSNFSDPQMIPTDAGCINTNSIVSTPEGIYFQSAAGLRLVTRSLSVEYVGGPVEDELGQYPLITSGVLYPTSNKLLLMVNNSNVPSIGPGGIYTAGEVLVRDYVLDAWTTTVLGIGVGFISSAIAYANGSQGSWNLAPGQAWYGLTSDGTIWRERNPASAIAYWDGPNSSKVYVTSTWLSPPIKLQDLNRVRCYDIILWGVSEDPHGISISVGIDYGAVGLNKTWTWNSATPGANNIAPNGSTPLPLTQLRSYDGRLGQAFQVQIQDVPDLSASSGQGFQVLGLAVTVGTYQRQPYKLPTGSTQ